MVHAIARQRQTRKAGGPQAAHNLSCLATGDSSAAERLRVPCPLQDPAHIHAACSGDYGEWARRWAGQEGRGRASGGKAPLDWWDGEAGCRSPPIRCHGFSRDSKMYITIYVQSCNYCNMQRLLSIMPAYSWGDRTLRVRRTNAAIRN